MTISILAAHQTSTSPKIKSSLLVSLPVIYLVLFSILPVLIFLFRAGFDPQPTLEHLKMFFSSEIYLGQLYNTLGISALVTLISILIGYPLAWLLVNASSRLKPWLIALVVLPFWTSVLVRSFAWILILSDVGIINKLLLFMHAIDDSIPFTGTIWATLAGMVYVMLPYAVLIIYTALSRIEPTLLRAAGTMGARPWQVFMFVILPLSMPGVSSAILLIFIESLGFYITPSLLGSVGNTMIAQSIEQQISLLLNWGFAAMISLVLLLTSVIIYYLYIRLAGIEGLWSAFSGSEGTTSVKKRCGKNINSFTSIRIISDRFEMFFARHLADGMLMLRALPFASQALGWTILIYLAMPLLIVVIASFSSAGYLTFPPPGFSLRWYEEVFTSDSWMQGLRNSTLVGTGAGVVSAVFGVMAAFALQSVSSKARSALTLVFLNPLLLPRMVAAVGSLYFFARLGLSGTPLALILVHATLGIPLVMITVSTVLASFDTRLTQAAATLGASPVKVFIHISLPLIMPGIVAGSLFAFITSFDDLVIALFMTNGQFQTLPKVMWDDIQLNVRPTLAAIATLLMLLSAFVVALSGAMRKRNT